MMEKSSTLQRIFTEGVSRVYTIKSYRHIETPREPFPRATYPEVNQDVYREVDQDSTEATYRERSDTVDWMVTEADFQRRRLVK
jgi:hypothetical protein